MNRERVEGFVVGFCAGALAFGALLGFAIAEIERGRSVDAWLRTLSARTWAVDKK